MNFETIIGYENEKKELSQLGGMLRNIKVYRDHGLRMPKGLLLVGEPGVGKTAMARAMAGDGVTLVELKAADCCGEELGSAIHEAFEEAKKGAPTVLLLDELDKTAGTSMEFFMQPNDEVKKILLQELDALTDSDGVLVVATANDADSLGEALTRPGRFDHLLKIDLPDTEIREKILDSYFKKVKLRRRFDLKTLGRLTAGFSCADLECLVNETGIAVLDQGKKSISTEDVSAMINRLSFHGQVKDSPEDVEELYRVAVHEAGHALVAMFLKPDSVYGASILPQGESLGHVRMMEGDQKGVSMDDLMDQICITLAGRVAEREVLGKMFLGSGDDLQKAGQWMMDLIVPNAAFGYRNMIGMFHFLQGGGTAVSAGIVQIFEEKMNAMDEKAKLLIQGNRELFDGIAANLVNQKALSREMLFSLKEGEAAKAA